RIRRERAMATRPTAGIHAVLASDFRSSMLAMAHLVSTSTASLWAFIAISVSSLALFTAVSYIDFAAAIWSAGWKSIGRSKPLVPRNRSTEARTISLWRWANAL